MVPARSTVPLRDACWAGRRVTLGPQRRALPRSPEVTEPETPEQWSSQRGARGRPSGLTVQDRDRARERVEVGRDEESLLVDPGQFVPLGEVSGHVVSGDGLPEIRRQTKPMLSSGGRCGW